MASPTNARRGLQVRDRFRRPPRRYDTDVTLRLVLDTNVYGYGALAKLALLAERGLLLSVSEIAFTEALARSAREFRTGGMRRGRARGKFFGRSKSLAPYLDPACPVALGAGGITRRVAAQTTGGPPVQVAEERSRLLNAMWQVVVGHEFSDEEWVRQGRVAEEWLTWRDETLFTTIRAVRDQREPPRWAAMSQAERLAAIRTSLATFWGFSRAMIERLDAHVATVAYRMLEGERGSRLPKENDGADVHLTQHLAEGAVLVTNDERLIDIVDRSGTYQAPWVRRLDELESLPEGLPWGEGARQQAASFNREPSRDDRRRRSDRL